ncbi:hypothetical protein, partial [Paraburkholderia elongata]|uniref:hypothetical protein n=1 Tax=Paraburkholderia elongata TaxID=2675747 RepID=UPI001C12E421
MANKFMFWPVIKVVMLLVVLVAGLSVQPVANMPLGSWVFIGALASAMGFFPSPYTHLRPARAERERG